MRTNPDDIAADVAELEGRVKLAYQRSLQLQLRLAAALEVYETLNKAQKRLQDFAQLISQLPNIEESALERARQSAEMPF